MANNSKVKTFISDYIISISDYTWSKGIRHIILRRTSISTDHNTSLCDTIDLNISSYGLTESDFSDHFVIYKSLCTKCLKKMPEELIEELKFNYIVKKLKS